LLSPVGAAGQARTFSYTGGPQSYVVPAGVHEVAFEARGGDGANVVCGADSAPGGAGAQYAGRIAVSPGETLAVNVGGRGNGLAGGSGGGGSGAVAGSFAGCDGAGGGGATDIRRAASKLLVAAGGGGACAGVPGGNAGADGGPAGSGMRGRRGTTTAGGAGGVLVGAGDGSAGTSGRGGDAGLGVSATYFDGGGGGGGGLYGGGGGSGGCGSGGGGASFAGAGVTADAVPNAPGARHGSVTLVPTSAGCAEGQVGTPPACLEPAIPDPASDECVSPTAQVALDGYVGSLYARLRTQQAGSETWVCARLQPEGGTEYAGGKLVVGGDSPVTVDDQHGACAAQGGNLHLTGGEFGDPSDPTGHLPYSLDAWRGGDEAWVCLRAGLGARIAYTGEAVASSFQQDDPGTAIAPPRTPWTPGVASADCEAQVGGTKTRLVNAVVGGVQVWVTGWRSEGRAMLCVRTDDGTSTHGGRLSLDATGSPGLQPITQVGSDTAGCTTNVLSNDTAQLAVRRSGSNDNPAAVCVTRGATTVRLTLGFSGELDPPDVDWRPDV
jgi:hypothetical protein